MIIEDIYDIMKIVDISMNGLMNLLVFILLIVVGVRTLKKELGSDCKKGFSRYFVGFLVFLMISTFFIFANSLIFKIVNDLRDTGEISDGDFYRIMSISGLISTIFRLLNDWIAYTLLLVSMEIYLFNKKSNWKFGILAIILQFGSFLLIIIGILTGIIGITITSILINFNYAILGVVILILLGKTAKENELLKIYKKPIFIGVIFILIIKPLLMPIPNIFLLMCVYLNFDFDIYFWVSQGVLILQTIIFVIGIIFLSIGAIKTMSVPLTFAMEKGAKRIPRKATNACSQCGSPIPPGVEFCTNCGRHL